MRRVVLSEFLNQKTQNIGPLFEQNARVGVHFSAEQPLARMLSPVPKFEAARHQPGIFIQVEG